MKLKSLLAIPLFVAAASAAAVGPLGESGVIINGRVIVLFKNGRKIADPPDELKTANDKDKKDGPSVDASKSVLWYQTFSKDGAQFMCMTLPNEVGLSCVKVK